jgi:hypothetical protein
MLAEPDLAGAPGAILVAGPHAGLLGVTFYSQGRPRLKLRQWQPKPEAGTTTADRLDAETSGAASMTTAELAAFIKTGGRPRLFLDGDDFALIDPVVAGLPGFAEARRRTYPGLTVFEW